MTEGLIGGHVPGGHRDPELAHPDDANQDAAHPLDAAYAPRRRRGHDYESHDVATAAYLAREDDPGHWDPPSPAEYAGLEDERA